MNGYERYCPRCGGVLHETLGDYDDLGIMYDFSCPQCGLEISANVPHDKPEPTDIDNQGFGKCPFCGGWLYWNSDFMFSDFIGEDLPEDQDTLVQNVTCSKCGAELRCVYPVE